jgi:hypothetical protein
MHADSIPINRATPTYPPAEITAMMKLARAAMIFSDMQFEYSRQASNLLMR